MMVPPDSSSSARHARERSRQRSSLGLALGASGASTTTWVAMPAWSGARHPQRAEAIHALHPISTSCSVLFSAWPMWREPVTLGGGMTIE